MKITIDSNYYIEIHQGRPGQAYAAKKKVPEHIYVGFRQDHELLDACDTFEEAVRVIAVDRVVSQGGELTPAEFRWHVEDEEHMIWGDML